MHSRAQSNAAPGWRAPTRHRPIGRPENTQAARRALRAMRSAPHPDGHRFRELRWLGSLGAGITLEQAASDFASAARGQCIRILLDCAGGSLAEARAIMVLIERHTGRVRVTVRADCCGAGLLLLAAADQRYARPDAQFRLCFADPPETGERCTAAALRRRARLIEAQRIELPKLLAARWGVGAGTVAGLLDSNRAIGVAEAIRLGLLDGTEQWP